MCSQWKLLKHKSHSTNKYTDTYTLVKRIMKNLLKNKWYLYITTGILKLWEKVKKWNDMVKNYINCLFYLLLQNVDKWSFDVFALNDASGDHALKFIFYELLTRYDLINRFKVSS